MVLPMVQRATMGRPNPRAPYVAIDVMVKGAGLPLKEAIKIERDAFLDVATSAEGKAGMRFFFTQQSVQRLPKGFPGKARDVKRVGVDGADGFMGNAIAWLALEAGYDVVAHVPIAKFAPPSGEAHRQYGRALKKGSMSQDDLAAKLARAKVTTELKDLRRRPRDRGSAWRTARSRPGSTARSGRSSARARWSRPTRARWAPACSRRSSPRAAAARRAFSTSTSSAPPSTR
jgi:hypothetical protein